MSADVQTFAEGLRSRIAWLDKLKEQRKRLNEEIRETEDGIRTAIDTAADGQSVLPFVVVEGPGR